HNGELSHAIQAARKGQDASVSVHQENVGFDESGRAAAPTSSANRGRSMFPPETTTTIFPRPARPLKAAATAQPAAPSEITCARSATCRIARATSSSETTMDPANEQRSGHIDSSTDLPPAPSTNVAFHDSK